MPSSMVVVSTQWPDTTGSYFHGKWIFCIHIADNGVGRRAASDKFKAPGSDKGMGITKRRIKNSEGTVTVSDVLHTDGSTGGTAVVIRLPLPGGLRF